MNVTYLFYTEDSLLETYIADNGFYFCGKNKFRFFPFNKKAIPYTLFTRENVLKGKKGTLPYKTSTHIYKLVNIIHVPTISPGLFLFEFNISFFVNRIIYIHVLLIKDIKDIITQNLIKIVLFHTEFVDYPFIKRPFHCSKARLCKEERFDIINNLYNTF